MSTGEAVSPTLFETVCAPHAVAGGDTQVTFMTWLPLCASQEEQAHKTPEHLYLCIGFSHGGISLFTTSGAVHMSFLLHAKPVVSIRFSIGSGERRMTILHSGGLVAVVPLTALHAAADACSDTGQRTALDLPLQNLQHHTYQLYDREATVDACLLDMVQAVEDVFSIECSSGIIALGTRPFLSQHRINADGLSLRSVIGGAASAVFSLARSWNPFRKGEQETPAPRLAAAGLLASSDLQVRPRVKPEDVVTSARFVDPARTGERLEPAPARPRHLEATPLLATCDAYGRVGLFCCETLRCLHLWKGYRDAQVAWIVQPSPGHLTDDSQGSMGLFIYAPRRGLLELWDVCDHCGPVRIDAAAVDCECQLLSCDGCACAYLIWPSGRLDKLNWNRSTLSQELARSNASEPDSENFNSLSSEGGDDPPSGSDDDGKGDETLPGGASHTSAFGRDEFAALTGAATVLASPVETTKT